jgi:hypothetical protein
MKTRNQATTWTENFVPWILTFYEFSDIQIINRFKQLGRAENEHKALQTRLRKTEGNNKKVFPSLTPIQLYEVSDWSARKSFRQQVYKPLQ